MKKYFVLFTMLSIVSFFLINCSDDEVTNPDNGGKDPKVNITSPLDGESFIEGVSITFAGAGEDFEGAALPDSVLIWRSDVNDNIGTGTSFENDNLSLGPHVITLTGTDSKGRSDSESISIDVTPSAAFVLIRADTFTMGSPSDEPNRDSDETLHLVTLTSDFYISATEITNQQYADMAQWAYDRGWCTATSSSLQDNIDGSTEELLDLDSGDCEISFSSETFTVDTGKENHPVVEVSWYGAVSYCDWLNLKNDLARAYDHSSWECNGDDPYNAQGYRLPTEAEWEYACRAGSQTAFANGDITDTGCSDPVLDVIGWYCGNASGSTNPVSQLISNDWDLSDMHGNVWEWCNDWYDDYNGDETDPAGPDTDRISRVIRGGCFANDADDTRSAGRNWSHPTFTSFSIGFRVCRGGFSR
jgi:formylglycine-generating enzyme required for sulfatase activity